MNYIYDANALIAYLEDEPGADLVDELLSNPANLAFAHSINLCEVYYGARREHGENAARKAIIELRNAGISIRDDMDEELWQSAGKLKADYRRISIADCFCAALAVRVDGEVITADKEYEPLCNDGVCKVRFIR